jgi:hypothetical protein
VQAGRAVVLARLKDLEAAGYVDSMKEDRVIKWLLARRVAA